MLKAYCSLVVALGLVTFATSTGWAEDEWQKVTATKVDKAPILDGKADDWSAVPAVAVKVTPAVEGDTKNPTGTIDVQLKSVVSGDMIYFLAQWPDDTKDVTHKTLHWNKEKDSYEEGNDQEDRLALRFDMGGDFAACMLSGTEYKADEWHWKAYRSQTAGVAHDKLQVFSIGQLPKAKEHKTKNGKSIWIYRPDDKGDELYTSQRPVDKTDETLPRYIVNTNATGSVMDVKTAANWDNQAWTLEMARKLDTGNDDDVKFEKGKTYKAGVAVFNHTGDDHHSTSGFVLEIAQ